MTDTPRRQANQTNPVFQLRLTMKFQQSDIVIKSLTVVIVMDVCSCDAQSLSARASVLTSEIVIAHSHIDRVAGPHDAGNERFSQFPRFLKFVRGRKHLLTWWRNAPRWGPTAFLSAHLRTSTDWGSLLKQPANTTRWHPHPHHLPHARFSQSFVPESDRVRFPSRRKRTYYTPDFWWWRWPSSSHL